ncbi:MAG: DNA-binding protein [Candidatus Omnitrophota bacterium]
MKSLFFCPVLFLVLMLSATPVYSQAAAGLDLINNTQQYDGSIVSYKGEVVGEVMARGDYAWLHVNDGSIAIGIWAPKNMVKDILHGGDYHNKGDVVEISGTFHRSCLEHGGDLDIHAVAIKKVIPGNPVIHSVSRRKILAGILSLALVLLFYALKKFFQSK